jgi:hypothetical protein
MATGGYKLVKFSWQGGRTDSALARCKFVLHGFCSAIVDANLGWNWDTDFNDGSLGSCATMGGHTDGSPNIAYILKLVYNGHTYRMCVALNYIIQQHLENRTVSLIILLMREQVRIINSQEHYIQD